MKRLHVHLAVADLEQSVGFYSALFAAGPTVRRDDYAKWQLDDPRMNFAISARGRKPGLDHLGLQVDAEDELAELEQRLADASLPVLEQRGAACCYARSDKYWTLDPQGVPWESFHTLGEIPVYGSDLRESPGKAGSGCCSPAPGTIPAGGSKTD